MSDPRARRQATVRRRATLVLVATFLAGGVMAAVPGLDPAARVPVPAGAVIESTAAPTGAGRKESDPTRVAAGPSLARAAPIPGVISTRGPVPTREPLVAAPALAGDGPRPADPWSLTGYRWPLPRGRITGDFGPSPFGALLVSGRRFHDGLDLATFCGDHVLAAHAGLVVAAGRRFDPWMGWIGSLAAHTRKMNREQAWSSLPIVVVIDDGNGYRSIYAHFNAIAVKPGQRLKAGQFLGWEGQTGKATGCHLHYGLFSPFETRRFELRPDVRQRTRYPRWEIARIDPLLVLRPEPGPSTASAPSAAPGPSLDLRRAGSAGQ